MRDEPAPPARLHGGEEGQRPEAKQRRDEVLLPEETTVPDSGGADGEDKRAPCRHTPTEATQRGYIADRHADDVPERQCDGLWQWVRGKGGDGQQEIDADGRVEEAN